MTSSDVAAGAALRPFEIAIADRDIDDLRERLAATRWPDDPANDGWHYGTNAEYLRELCEAWQSFDWRAAERRLNEGDHHLVEVGGQTLHIQRFNEGAGTPLLLLGGWPWTFDDFRDVVPQLAGFEVVVADLPGYGFSTPLSAPRIGMLATADLMHELMTAVLGHERYGVYGGDWGSLIAEQMAHRYGEALVGLFTSMPFPLSFQPPSPELYSADEAEFAQRTAAWAEHGNAYFQLQGTKPQTIAYLNDSPAAMASWIVEKLHGWTDHGGNVEDAYPRDRILTTLSVYWFTQTIGSAARFYAESLQNPWQPEREGDPVVEVPTGIAMFPKEVAQMPRAWAEQYFNLRRYVRLDRGGHFPAVENPDGLAREIAGFFTEDVR